MKTCKTCGLLLSNSEFYKNSHMKDGRLNDCKMCCKLKTSPAALRKASAKYKKNNPDKIKDYQKNYSALNREKIADRMHHWRKTNIASRNAYKASKRALKRNATPSWLTADDRNQIKEIYIKARQLTEETGTSYVVDHIIPLVGNMVCGLHVPSNLQVVTRLENAVKYNKLVEDIV